MTELEFEILNFASSKPDVHWIAMLNDLHDRHSYEETGIAAKHLLVSGFLKNCTPSEHPPYCRISLSEEGHYLLLREKSDRQEQVRKEQSAKDERNRLLKAKAANHAKEKRSDRRFQLMLSLLQAFLSFATGLLIEYHVGIIELIKHFLEH